ncbi:AbrB/MazE/SpoVT family DNA-binding domain-containing protein [Stetteria hydrogenophila]
MSIEVRRVQRLGSSSLVVTIPKEWASRLGIQAGSKVYLVDEGDSIKIMPRLPGMEEASASLDLTRLDPGMLARVASCIYLAGLSDVTVRVSGDAGEAAYLMRKGSESLSMVDVSIDGGDSLRVRILLDADKVDVASLIRSLGFNAVRFLKLLERVTSKGSIDQQDLEEAGFLGREFMRLQHTIIRYLTMEKLSKLTMADLIHASLGASYLGFANDTLRSTITLLRRIGVPSLGEEHFKLMKDIGSLIQLSARLIVSPSHRRLKEAFDSLQEVRERLESMMASSGDAQVAVLLSRLHTVLRIVNITLYIAACKSILSSVSHGGSG